MRTIVLALLLLPIFTLAQKQEVYIRLTDAGGKQISGDATTKGFEKWLQALTVSSGGKNNTQQSFSMNISGASADLKKALAGKESLLTGQVSVMQAGGSAGRPVTLYTIKMEQITVLSCSETMGCSNTMTTSVTLQASRIGWTYYQTSPSGSQTVSRKFGWDAGTNSAWNNF
jgi:type VI protein secretion system component Hcp